VVTGVDTKAFFPFFIVVPPEQTVLLHPMFCNIAILKFQAFDRKRLPTFLRAIGPNQYFHEIGRVCVGRLQRWLSTLSGVMLWALRCAPITTSLRKTQ
jgi:hypothetical protein